MTTESTFSYSQRYYHHNISVIPILARDKMPAVKTWLPYQRIRAEKNTLKEWFEKTDNNIGVVTGKISELAIVDLDTEECYRSLVDKNKWLKDEITVKTGKGYHIWFKLFEYENTLRFELNGVACHIKMNGGQCVAPPSTHVSGNKYKFFRPQDEKFWERDTVDIAQLKRAINSAGGVFAAEQIKDRNISWASELCQPVPTGQRNDSAARLCGLLIRKHPQDPGLIKWIMEAWNKDFCTPPLSGHELNILVESELRRYLP